MTQVYKQVCNNTFSFEFDYHESLYVITKYNSDGSEVTMSLDQDELEDFLDFSKVVIKEYKV